MSKSSKETKSFGQKLPNISSEIPGSESVKYVEKLSRTEIPAITRRRANRAEEADVEEEPIVWHRAHGANIEDVDGNRYVDLSSGFGVSSFGHAADDITDAVTDQAKTLMHQMGDVYPSDVKIDFCERLADVTPGSLQQSILGLSGSDAVQAALRTAVMHTGKSGVISFWGGFHGLEYGALEVTGYKDGFREPFRSQLGFDVTRMPYPDPFRSPEALDGNGNEQKMLDRLFSLIDESLSRPSSGVEDIGAIITEPIQGRGGVVVPPDGYLEGLRQICDKHDIVLIVDEVYTGFGRTGDWFASSKRGVTPDILCLGKAMGGGGLPVSAAVGKKEVMSSWGKPDSEALHTSTFLGHPLGCAAALKVIEKLDTEDWFGTIEQKGAYLEEQLIGIANKHSDVIGDVRGEGMMRALEFVKEDSQKAPALNLRREVLEQCLKEGYLALPSGAQGNVLSMTPPFVITKEQIDGFIEVLDRSLQ